jgi:hypothetical protein
MIKTEIFYKRNFQPGPVSLASEPDAVVNLSTIEVVTTRAPDYHDYPELFRRIALVIRPLTDLLVIDGYKLRLFLVGAPLTTERRESVSYDLARPARKCHLISGDFREKVYPSDDRHRSSGIYELQQDMLAESIQFVAESAWSLLIITKRGNFFAESNLDRLYGSATEGVSPLSLVALNWRRVAFEACSHGDIIIKSWIEDLTRSALIVASAETLANLNCPPLVDAS